MSTILFGADPEGFYTDGKKVIPPARYRLDNGFPVTYLPRDRYKKHPVFTSADGLNGKIHLIEDGAAFELTVAPSKTMRDLWHDIQIGYVLAKGVADLFGDAIAVIPAIPFDTEEFIGREEEFLMSLVFGCDPDQDVFEEMGLVNVLPMEEDALQHPWRYGGGHLHISGISDFHEKPLPAVQLLALTVGNLVTYKSTMKELDHTRVYRYGRPGRFRIQEYGDLYDGIPYTDVGIEYRTPSNNWTTSQAIAEAIEVTIRLMAEQILADDRVLESVLDDFRDPTVKAVMTGDEELARKTFQDVMNWTDLAGAIL